MSDAVLSTLHVLIDNNPLRRSHCPHLMQEVTGRVNCLGTHRLEVGKLAFKP